MIAPALAAALVVLAPFPGPALTEGPQLAGDRVAWSQTDCLEGCTLFSSQDTKRYEVRAVGPGGRATVFAKRLTSARSGPNFAVDHFDFLLSEQVLATVKRTFRGDEVEGESGRVRLRAGPPGAARRTLASCSELFFDTLTPVALEGSRIVFPPDPCEETPKLVLRDLASGATQPLPDPAERVSEVRLRGGFVAWIEPGRLVAHDLAAGTTRSAALPGLTALDVDTDGTVAAVAGDPEDPCAGGRLYRWAADAPAPAELALPVCASGVRIDRGRVVVLGRDGFFRTLQSVGPGGEVEDLVRFGRVIASGFDARDGRIAWTERDCGGGEAILTAPLIGAPLSAGSINCRARFRRGAVPVHGALARVRLSCPRGCAGELSLRHAGRREFALSSSEREVRVRLRLPARRRLARLGSLETVAKLVTRNRAGDRHARSRAVTLVAR